MRTSAPGGAPVVASDARTWLPGRTRAETAALQHDLLSRHGAPAPIPVWRCGEDRRVIDDIERFEYCVAHKVEAAFVEFEFESEDDARLFVLERNQARQISSALGRRYIEGAIYNLSRRPGARSDLTSPQGEGRSAAAKVHQRFGRSRASLERDGRLARQIDDAAAVHGPNIRSMLLEPKNRLSAAHIERFASISLEEQDLVLDALKHGVLHARLRRSVVPQGELPEGSAVAVEQLEGGARNDSPAEPKLATAVKALLAQFTAVEVALEDEMRPDADSNSLFERSVRQISSRYNTLHRKLKEAQAKSATTPLDGEATAESAAASHEPQLPSGFVLRNWTVAAAELPTEGVVEEIRRMISLADALEGNGHVGVPLGIGGEFVTVEALRQRADVLEAELALRHVAPAATSAACST